MNIFFAYKILLIKFFFIIIFVNVFLINSCAHKTNVVKVSNISNNPIHVQERKETFDNIQMPLPSLEKLWVDWRYADDTVRSVLVLKCWNFNRKDTCNMLEIMPLADNPKICIYDFDDDAQIDAIEKCNLSP